MYSLLVSLISIALVAACALITAIYIGKPFTDFYDRAIILEINKNYIDFGMIFSSADNLSNTITNIDDLKNYNGELPKINNQDYNFLINYKKERILYSNNINDSQCASYESHRTNNSLNIEDITYNIDFNDYIENNMNNISCYKSLIDEKNYLVFIYPSLVN